MTKKSKYPNIKKSKLYIKKPTNTDYQHFTSNNIYIELLVSDTCILHSIQHGDNKTN